MNGANIDNGKYHPQTTSYDYDAALDESGRPTPKYYAFRDLIARYTKSPLSPFPVTDSTVAVAGFALAPMTSLWQMLPKPAHVDRPRSMETFGQSYGYILYRTTVPGPLEGELVIRDVRDYARIYVNGQLQATLDRRLNQDSAVLRLPAGDARLDILVENGGRVNFTKALRGERKGITKSVTLGGRELTGWDVYTLPMSSTPEPRASTGTTTGPAIYYGTFTTTKPGDTYLDMTGWGKGAVWVNGHALGRFWQIGPQLSLYLPGVWIRNGVNQVTVFDFDQPAANVIRGVEHAVWK
jgi:beta-galactosidase